jgi:cytochrome oxidase assembly protein ShyY1
MPPTAPESEVTVIGRVRVSDEKQFGEIDNSTQADLVEIQRIDLDILDEVIDGDLLNVSIDALESSPTDDPRLAPVAEPTLSSGPHLSYTVQWILFSACAVAAWALLVRRALRT